VPGQLRPCLSLQAGERSRRAARQSHSAFPGSPIRRSRRSPRRCSPFAGLCAKCARVGAGSRTGHGLLPYAGTLERTGRGAFAGAHAAHGGARGAAHRRRRRPAPPPHGVWCLCGRAARAAPGFRGFSGSQAAPQV